MEAKRPRMETVSEAHITRTPSTAGGVVLPMTHTVQDSLRATVEVKKVGPVPLQALFQTKKSVGFTCFCPCRHKLSQVHFTVVYSTFIFSYPLLHNVRTSSVVSCQLNEPFFVFCQESQFTVKVESPSAGGHTLHMVEEQDTSPSKLSKEELIQSMDRVDREIAKVEQQIFKLKKKQVGYHITIFTVSTNMHPTQWMLCEKTWQE